MSSSPERRLRRRHTPGPEKSMNRNGIHLLPPQEQQVQMHVAQPLGPDAMIAFVATPLAAAGRTPKEAVEQAVEICARAVLAVEQGAVMKRIGELKAALQQPA